MLVPVNAHLPIARDASCATIADTAMPPGTLMLGIAKSLVVYAILSAIGTLIFLVAGCFLIKYPNSAGPHWWTLIAHLCILWSGFNVGSVAIGYTLQRKHSAALLYLSAFAVTLGIFSIPAFFAVFFAIITIIEDLTRILSISLSIGWACIGLSMHRRYGDSARPAQSQRL